MLLSMAFSDVGDLLISLISLSGYKQAYDQKQKVVDLLFRLIHSSFLLGEKFTYRQVYVHGFTTFLACYSFFSSKKISIETAMPTVSDV